MAERGRGRAAFSEDSDASPPSNFQRSKARALTTAHNMHPGSAFGGRGEMDEEKPLMDQELTTVNSLLAGTSVGFFAPKLLIFGCIIGLCGFVVVCVVMFVCEWEMEQSKKLMTECADYRPLPTSVSDLVHRWDSVCGRIFFGLELIAGLSIYLSSYGFCFRNCACDCYVHLPFKCCNRLVHELDLRWCDVRQFVVPVGLMLVCLVPTIPVASIQGKHEVIMVFCHMMAAFMMFLGMMACEYHFYTTHVGHATEASEHDDEYDPTPERLHKCQERLYPCDCWCFCFCSYKGRDELCHYEYRDRVEDVAFDLLTNDYHCPKPRPDDGSECGASKQIYLEVYIVTYKEYSWRKCTNVGSVVFFFAFIVFQALLDQGGCGNATFKRIPVHEPCQRMTSCSDILDEDAGMDEDGVVRARVDGGKWCEAANALLIDQQAYKIRMADPRLGDPLLQVDIRYPPQPVVDNQQQASLRNLPQGCFVRESRSKGNNVPKDWPTFYWNADKNGVSISHDDSLTRVCKCGVHVEKLADREDGFTSAILASVFQPSTRSGITLAKLHEDLRRKNFDGDTEIAGSESDDDMPRNEDEESQNSDRDGSNFKAKGEGEEKEEEIEEEERKRKESRTNWGKYTHFAKPKEPIVRSGDSKIVRPANEQGDENRRMKQREKRAAEDNKLLEARQNGLGETDQKRGGGENMYRHSADGSRSPRKSKNFHSIYDSEGPGAGLEVDAGSLNTIDTMTKEEKRKAELDKPMTNLERSVAESMTHSISTEADADLEEMRAEEGTVEGTVDLQEVSLKRSPASDLNEHDQGYVPLPGRTKHTLGASVHMDDDDEDIGPNAGRTKRFGKTGISEIGETAENSDSEDVNDEGMGSRGGLPMNLDTSSRAIDKVWDGVRPMTCKLYTMASFCTEVIAGICVVMTHLVIWYYCEERALFQKMRVNTKTHAFKYSHRTALKAIKFHEQEEKRRMEEEKTRARMDRRKVLEASRSAVMDSDASDSGSDQEDPIRFIHNRV